jgi:hypothetical protein
MKHFGRARIWITIAVASAVVILPLILGSVLWGD